MPDNSASTAKKRLEDQWRESNRVKEAFFTENSDRMLEAASLIGAALKRGGKLLICGNGGSASDAQHFAGEMVGRFLKERRALPALSLATDTSVLTAVGNDYGYEHVFSRQVDGLGASGDILVAISTSGKSPNVLRAVRSAKAKGMRVIGLTGGSGGELGKECDLHLNVALGKNSPRIQEAHITIIHLLVDLVDEFHSP